MSTPEGHRQPASICSRNAVCKACSFPHEIDDGDDVDDDDEEDRVTFQLCHTSHPSFVVPPLPSLPLSEDNHSHLDFEELKI